MDIWSRGMICYIEQVFTALPKHMRHLPGYAHLYTQIYTGLWQATSLASYVNQCFLHDVDAGGALNLLTTRLLMDILSVFFLS